MSQWIFMVAALVFAPLANAVESYQLFERYEIERRNFQKEVAEFGKNYVTKKVAERNAYELAALKDSARPNPHSNRADVVPADLLEEIYYNVANNPVTSLAAYNKYDPTDRGIGFCFGRAMNVHLEALFQGVSKNSIRKLWALGQLRTGSTGWRYHVTTLLKGEKGWMAVDPIFGYVMTVEQWYRRMQSFDTDGLMRLYVTEPEKFGPSSTKYHDSLLIHPIYNNYFMDLMAYYRERTRQPRERRP